MKTTTWNTGRKYTARGQVIVATLHDDDVITFADHSRMIYGEFAADPAFLFFGSDIRKEVMAAYDAGKYSNTTRATRDGMYRGGCNTEK